MHACKQLTLREEVNDWIVFFLESEASNCDFEPLMRKKHLRQLHRFTLACVGLRGRVLLWGMEEEARGTGERSSPRPASLVGWRT